jgi:hypothetical protein
MHCAALGLRERRWQAAWVSEQGSRNGCHSGCSQGKAISLSVYKFICICTFRCAKWVAQQCIPMLRWSGSWLMTQNPAKQLRWICWRAALVR